MMTSFASAAMARQMATSCRLAIERCETFSSRSSATLMRCIAAEAVARTAGQFTTPISLRCRPMAMFSATVRFGNRDRSW